MTTPASSSRAPETPDAATTSSSLGHGLKTRHLTMMGLGSAIGAGLFLGTGVGIEAAGPAVLLAYIVAGVIVMLVMQTLGEMAAARPSSGSFSTYARQAFGHWAGFMTGWIYWFMLTMVLGAEMTGASAIMAGWFGVDPWIPALVCVVFFAVVNFAQVRGFGEFEYWFSLIKVAVIIGFLVVGVLLFFGWLPDAEPILFSNIAQVDFAPNGLPGVAAGLLAVAFAFGGIELVTIAAAESENPAASIRTAVRSVIVRISVFYLGSVLAIIMLLPYDQISGADTADESPFTRVLALANIPGVVGFMEAVIVLALLSAFNAQIYATSRLVHRLAMEGDAPRIFAKTNSERVPINAVVLSMFFAFVSVGLQWWNPTGLLTFLLNAVGGCLLVVWVMIMLSYLKLHPVLEANGEISTVRMWGFPWLGYLTLAALAGLVVLMLFDAGARMQIISVAAVVAVLVILSLFTRNNPPLSSEAMSVQRRRPVTQKD
ncbi:amino acid permease [Corynebacterium guangdongense]|uniref:Aromatic amino acid permease n=1 Tax=Corynebacterium guangdongense TaxID=1783348 RepID=A0ABU1ZVR5_9CORY|nr:amino acid permease [Corynebacterium guangdongense]MDR7329027.1 aromatic amino acid permease [Corynebacterium guangdongense]WJZ17597.1 GABA permease [Corynebacterium guangdongense]